MKRVKKVFVLVHVVLWVLYSLLVALQASQDSPTWHGLAAGVILSSLYVFYCHFLLLTQYLGKNQKRAYFLRLAVIFFSGPLLFLVFRNMGATVPLKVFEPYIMTLMTLVPVFLFLSWLARITENLVVNTIKKEQLEKQAVESELYYLKSQINPHFLFNTLNNIHTLVYKQAPAAPEAVMRLASLMRYMIYESNALLVPLSRELDYLQDYIGLQQLRYKNSPVVDLTVQGAVAQCHVAPLLFIHLLENAYKHSPARLESKAIAVRIEIQENTLIFSVKNPVAQTPTVPLEEPGGIGLPNVQKRLALLYPGRHTLQIHRTEQEFTITLTLNGLHAPTHERKANLLYH